MSGKTIHVLLVEDDPAHTEAIRRALEISVLKVAIEVVDTLGDYRTAVAGNPPDIALVDLNLPDGRAVELLSSPPQDAPFPILIMTSYGNEQTAVEALKSGALDYVVKSPEAFAGIPRSIERVLREWNLLQERKQAAEALMAAKEAAEAASRAKSEFLAVISHELRTPLNGVMGGVQMLRCTNLSAEQQEYVDLIMFSAENQLSMVNDLLDLARFETGDIGIEKEVFLLRECLNDTVKLQKAGIRDKGLTLSVDLGPDIPDEVIGDALRFRQILLKLLANAVKFTESGGITIRLELVSRQEDDIVIRCSVADTGIGVPREQVDKIFAPFVQADMSTTRRYGGSGLGLAISRRLTEALGGRIWYEGNQGQGSIFSFELPFHRKPVPALQAVTQPGSAILPATQNLRPLKVLIVDDDATSLKVIAGILCTFKHCVITAENGREALDRWKDTGPFDAILMDVQMPVMSGIEVLNTIREMEREQGGHVPIIAQTAHSMKKDQEHLLAEGFDGYLPKPLIIQDLLEQMRLLTDTSKGE